MEQSQLQRQRFSDELKLEAKKNDLNRFQYSVLLSASSISQPLLKSLADDNFHKTKEWQIICVFVSQPKRLVL